MHNRNLLYVNRTATSSTLLFGQSAGILTVLLLSFLWSNSFAQNGLGRGHTRTDRSEIMFTDSQSAIMEASIVSGGPVVVASGHKLMQPLGIAVAANGEIITSDTGCGAVLGIDLASGNQRVIASGGTLGVPYGIAIERDGNILAANAMALVRINPQTGQQTVVSSGQFFLAPIAVAVAENRDIFVVDLLGRVIRVDPDNGMQTLVASHGYLMRPQGIAVRGQHIYVTDVATADGNFGVGRVLHLDRQSGAQSVVAVGGYLVGPVGIAVDGSHLIVGDPYTINEASAELFDGAIISIDGANGAQTLIARGSGEHVNPRCVAVVNVADEEN